MDKRALLRSLSYSCRGLSHRSASTAAFFSASVEQHLHNGFSNHPFYLLKRAFSLLPKAVAAKSPNPCMLPTAIGIGNRHLFCTDVSQLPVISDPDIEGPFKDLLAASWDEIPDGVIHDVKKALSKTTEDKAGQEALVNVFRAAEAVEHFGGVLVSLRMELDDSIGLSGEKVGHMEEHFVDALRAAYKRYVTYLDAFGPDEAYLRKKVEMELGTKMIHLKMRCSGLDPEWGKVTVLGTSGLSGSYIEQRTA